MICLFHGPCNNHEPCNTFLDLFHGLSSLTIYIWMSQTGTSLQCYTSVTLTIGLPTHWYRVMDGNARVFCLRLCGTCFLFAGVPCCAVGPEASQERNRQIWDLASTKKVLIMGDTLYINWLVALFHEATNRISDGTYSW